MVIVMLGAPGTGKGTMSNLLSKYYQIPHISTGDLFRSEIKKGNSNGKILKEYVDQGLLVPDQYIEDIILNRLKMLDCKNGFILDGYPRTIEQTSSLENMLRQLNKKLTAVINLETPEDEIIDRIVNRLVCSSCGTIYNTKYSPPVIEGHCDVCDGDLMKRSDDTKEKVIERLREYEEKTKELNNYYSETEKMFTVLISDKANKLDKTALKDIVWFIEGLKE